MPARWPSCIAPFDEDFGYVTLEAFLARKPVITAADAGGPLEFVVDGVNGASCAPTPEAIGAAINRSRPTGGRARARRRGLRRARADHLGRRDREAGRRIIEAA